MPDCQTSPTTGCPGPDAAHSAPENKPHSPNADNAHYVILAGATLSRDTQQDLGVLPGRHPSDERYPWTLDLANLTRHVAFTECASRPAADYPSGSPMFLALREIRHEPVRFTLIISVITLVAYLTFFLASLAVGLAHRYRAGIDGWNTASVAVTDASNENLSASRLSDKQLKAATDLAKDNGTTASALMSTAAVAQAPDVKDEDGEALREDVFAFGIDLDGQLSPPVADGRTISAPDSEVLVDDSLKAKGLAVGDTIRLLGSDHDWTVVGFTHDTTFQAAPVVTMDSRALRQHGPTSLSPAVSAVVFTSDLTTDSKATQSAKDAGLTILTTEELVRTLPGYSAQVLTFSLMIGSLIIIASTVLGIFIYVLTLQKRPVLGILKARGVPTGYLIRSGCAQTLVLSVAGIGIGLLLTMATSLVLPRAVPFRISAPLDLLIVTAFIAISVIGGFISVRVISRIDPVEAIS